MSDLAGERELDALPTSFYIILPCWYAHFTRIEDLWLNLHAGRNVWIFLNQTPIKVRHWTRTSIGGTHVGVVSCRARRRRPRTSPLASECRRSRSNGHNGPAGELVKRRIRGPIIYFHTIHARRPALGRSAGVTPGRASCSADVSTRPKRLHTLLLRFNDIINNNI